MSNPTVNLQGNIYFTEQQLSYLETMFPQVVMPCSATEAQLRTYFGQQSVVQAVRDRTQSFKLKEARGNRGNPADSIPAPRR